MIPCLRQVSSAKPAQQTQHKPLLEANGVCGTNLLAAVTAYATLIVETDSLLIKAHRLGLAYLGALSAAAALALLDWLGNQSAPHQSGHGSGQKS